MAKPNNQLSQLKQAQQARKVMLAEWRSSRAQEITLPSGLHVWVKDVTMTDLLFTGKLPDGILDIADDANKNGQANIDLKKVAQSGPGFKDMMDALILQCIVEPPIAEVADDEHLGLNEISGDDKMFIFNWANREAEKLRPFREGENKPMETL